MSTSYTYRATLSASEKIRWRVEDIIGGERKLDFTKPFLPESLARVEPLTFLTSWEKKSLNQIRANTYLSMFGIVEEFILPFIVDHARPHLNGDDYRVRAMLQFATEEAKHIHLFRKFREEFDAGFETPCAVIGPADEIGKFVLSHHPLAVALVILQIEWMTQRHYLDSVADDGSLDPVFKSLLKHHWMEEAQHAKLDTLMVEAIADQNTPSQIDRAFEDYLAIGSFLDDGLSKQVELDLQSLMVATGRTFVDSEIEKYRKIQRQANRWTYLGSGMTHERFLETVGKLSPEAGKKFEELGAMFSQVRK